MTTIIAVETPNGVIFGSDSQSTMGHQKETLESGKIFTQGEYTIAVAGRARYMQVLKHTTLPRVRTEDIDQHVGGVLMPRLGRLETAADMKPGESIMILAVRGRAYLIIPSDSYERNASGIYGIGSGSEYALGYLASVPGTPTQADVLNSLEVAAKFDAYTSAPFKVVTV